MDRKNQNTAYLFEVSWEICNKVGGIHTVIATKIEDMAKEFGDRHILIGPDIDKNNREFTEDNGIFRSWQNKAMRDGLKIRTGRWNIAGNPTVILVDYKTFLPYKDGILGQMWNRYGVDSITGQWDYIEPVLFGYAAGKVIESYVNHYVYGKSRAIAQFHEWMTGSGLLYLRDAMPSVGCVFTTHATVLGRCLAGNGYPIYNEEITYNPEKTASDFGVTAKHSLEKKSAEFADCFTTVSEITDRECGKFLGKRADIITPNGFSSLRETNYYTKANRKGREKLLEIARGVLGREVREDSLLIGTSGRYEFKNKGLDVFINALGAVNSRTKKEIIAFLLVPAGHSGADKQLIDNLRRPDHSVESASGYTTHVLTDPDNDPIIKQIRQQNLLNRKEDKVKVIFAPCYLDGNDGIFNMSYYDILAGMDLTIFPSYYEPWGYTPLESAAYMVPTVTTSLAGFGMWIDSHCKTHPAVKVIHRTDSNSSEVVSAIADAITELSGKDQEEWTKLRSNAVEVASSALWSNLKQYYLEAYDTAVRKAEERIAKLPDKQMEWPFADSIIKEEKPSLTSIIVQRRIPEQLKALEELAENMWWCWNEDAKELFSSIDNELWVKSQFNPIVLLDSISYDRYNELRSDETFLKNLAGVYSEFSKYMKGKKSMDKTSIAYFSMEFGIHSSLKIYSGGLGILAGDYLKEASDKKTNITGIGLLYRYGYFDQKITATGSQEAEYEAQDFSKIPVTPVYDSNGRWIKVSIDLDDHTLYARIWRVDVGRVELYLLDTDYEDNNAEDRSITYHLYGGNWENRLKQEMLLGIGGIRALRQLGIDADIYHCNEGHAAFIGLERIKEFILDRHRPFAEAVELVRASSLFTTHTPVPAGHDAFDEQLMQKYFRRFSEEINLNWNMFMGLGRMNAMDMNEKFSMSFLAARLSQEINGVSKLHGQVSREIFKDLWKGYMPEELHISYVTNGVHYPTWTAREWKDVHNRVFGDKFKTHNYDKSCFDGIYSVDDRTITDTRNTLRAKLIGLIKEKIGDTQNVAFFTPKQIVEIKEKLRDDILTIGFARRFATYKRAHLLFSNLDRLNEIVNNPDRPVQFIFAGKAHPADKAGQDLIKRIIEISKYPQFMGKIIFIQNYNMDIAKLMVQGVDVWMNTPTRPLEASGTSGEKASMNGVMHFSVLDGWWVEGYREDAGWALPMERKYENQEYQNELDSEMIYNIIESEIAPAFYDRDKDGISTKWNNYIRNTIAKVASNFTTNRMLCDYERQYYKPMSERYRKLCENDYALACEITSWKRKVLTEWESVKVLKVNMPDKVSQSIMLGTPFIADVTIQTGALSAEEIGVELVSMVNENNNLKVVATHQFKSESQNGGKALYTLNILPKNPGQFLVGIRIYPKNPLLPHRQDLGLVKWAKA